MDSRVAKTASPARVQLWRQRIEAQRASGQSVRAWCLANPTGEHSFYWWRARLGLSAARARRHGGEGSRSRGIAKAVPTPRSRQVRGRCALLRHRACSPAPLPKL
jgi:hypothetical protein